jgi:hypothetical protein
MADAEEFSRLFDLESFILHGTDNASFPSRAPDMPLADITKAVLGRNQSLDDDIESETSSSVGNIYLFNSCLGLNIFSSQELQQIVQLTT